MSEESANAQMLTSSCTTGWSDWLWGELWLLPEGLFRRSTGARGLISAATLGMAGTVPAGSVRPITEREIQDTLAGSGRNRWLPRDQINEAALGQGLMNGRLRVVLTDGISAKLLWLKDDTVHDVLRSTLEEWLGNRLTLR